MKFELKIAFPTKRKNKTNKQTKQNMLSKLPALVSWHAGNASAFFTL